MLITAELLSQVENKEVLRQFDSFKSVTKVGLFNLLFAVQSKLSCH